MAQNNPPPPSTNNFTIPTPVVPSDPKVYEPAEDSFLLLDALEMDLNVQYQTHNFTPNLCLEIGCGSGIVSTGLLGTKYFKENTTCVFAMDLNPMACQLTHRTCATNGSPGKIECILGNGLLSDQILRFRFDLLICNPPYVPSPPNEFEDDSEDRLLKLAWDGGKDGNDFILPLLSVIPQLLADQGKAYLLLSSWNQPEELMENVIPKLGLKGFLVLKRNAGRERLSVWRLEKV